MCENELKKTGIKNQKRENHLESVISLHEATKSIINIMNQADIIGLFSELEGLPNAICEGMMLAKPIIMTRVSDFEVLVDENNGFLCDWDYPFSIRDTLRKAINLTNEDLIRMGKNSKEKAEKLFPEEVIINQWLSYI